ncbi:MAG: hypothetical protein H6817_11305 [Phycisphaerales bacterium]|nr:hypothetical protein [Phycisphaerales bacterium]
MTRKYMKLVAGGTATVALILLVAAAFTVNAQASNDQSPATKPAMAKDVVLTGTVVDLHCYMTGAMPSGDAAKCTADCIRAGVPAGLETDIGLVVLGQGMQGASKALLPYAHQFVEVRGKLFERDGVKYLDIASVEKAPKLTEEEGGETEN